MGMFFRDNKKNILRQPKIYSAPREQDPKKMSKALKILILIILVIIALIYVVFFSFVFKIKKIDTIGSSSEDSNIYLETFKNKNIFSLNSSQIAQDLKNKESQLENVTVSFGIPNVLRVKFEERNPIAVWQSDKDIYLVDENAIAFKKVDKAPENLLLVVDTNGLKLDVPSRIASNKFMSFIQDVKDKIKTLDMNAVSYEVNETTFQVEVVTDKNIKIIFDTTRSVSDQIDAAKEVYDTHKNDIKEYMDVRVEGKVYFK